MKKILLILLVILLASCGASKKIKDRSEAIDITSKSVEFKDTAIVSESSNEYIVEKKDVVEETVTITPLDTSKTITVDGKEYKNVIIHKQRKIDNSIINSSKEKDSIVTSSSTGRSISLDVKNAKIDVTSKEKEEPWIFYLSSFGFILLLLGLGYVYKKYIKIF